MALMDKNTQDQVRTLLAEIESPVNIYLFTQEFECGYCKETRQIAEEVAALSAKVNLHVHDFVADKALADSLKIDKIPAMAIMGEDDQDFGIRFYGIPSGYEFTSFLEALLMIGAKPHPMSPETVSFLEKLDQPVHLQVFVTPTCPYCPGAVVLAHQFARLSNKVTADMVEVTEFPYLGQKYQVMGVPRTVINETAYLEGAAPEQMLLEKLKAALGR